MSRVRSWKPVVVVSGTRDVYLGTTLISHYVNTYNHTTHWWECLDSITPAQPPYPDHDLDMRKGSMGAVRVNGTKVNGSLTRVYTDFPFTIGGAAWCSLTPSSLVSWSELKTQALANANPNVPIVDIPLFLFELKDLPSMIRQAGKLLARKGTARDAPGYYLGYQFGWAPLVRDLWNLTGIGKAIDERLKYIDRLGSGGSHIQRRLRVNTATPVVSTHYGDGYYGTAELTSNSKTTAWYSMWCAADQTYRPDNPRWEAIRSTLGLRLSYSTLWNMLPWSWMVDWFTTIGQHLNATRTGIPFRPTKLCIMQKTEFTHVLKMQPSVESISMVCESPPEGIAKRRKVYANPTSIPKFRLPMLSATQLGVLGALWAQMSFRR